MLTVLLSSMPYIMFPSVNIFPQLRANFLEGDVGGHTGLMTVFVEDILHTASV